jgi:hypothetical protein
MTAKRTIFPIAAALAMVLAAGAAVLVIPFGCARDKTPENKAKASPPLVLDYVVSGGLAGGEHRHLVAATQASAQAGIPQAKETWIVSDAGAREIARLLQEAGVFEWKSQSKGGWEDLFQHDLTVQAGGRKHSVTLYELPTGDKAPLEKLKKLLADVETVLKTEGTPPKGNWVATTENGDKPGTALALTEEGGKVSAGKFYILDPSHPGDLSKGKGYDLKDLVQEGKTLTCKATVVDESAKTKTKDLRFTITLKGEFKSNAVEAEVQDGAAAKTSATFTRK